MLKNNIREVKIKKSSKREIQVYQSLINQKQGSNFFTIFCFLQNIFRVMT